MVLCKKDGERLAIVFKAMMENTNLPLSEALEKSGFPNGWIKKVRATFKRIVLVAARYDISNESIMRFLHGNIDTTDTALLFITILYAPNEYISITQLKQSIKTYSGFNIWIPELHRILLKINEKYPWETQYVVSKEGDAVFSFTNS